MCEIFLSFFALFFDYENIFFCYFLHLTAAPTWRGVSTIFSSMTVWTTALMRHQCHQVRMLRKFWAFCTSRTWQSNSKAPRCALVNGIFEAHDSKMRIDFFKQFDRRFSCRIPSGFFEFIQKIWIAHSIREDKEREWCEMWQEMHFFHYYRLSQVYRLLQVINHLLPSKAGFSTGKIILYYLHSIKENGHKFCGQIINCPKLSTLLSVLCRT